MKKFNSRFSKKDIVSYILFLITAVVGLVCFQFFKDKYEYNSMLTVLIIVWGINIVIGAIEFKQRIIMILFDFCIFLFLITRVLIPAVQGEAWWLRYDVYANLFATYAILLSILSISAGVILVEAFSKIVFTKKKKKKNELVHREILLKIVRVILIACMVCFFIREFDKLLFMRGRVYEEYFSAYSSRVPFFITIPAGCMSIFLCILLALKPSKKESFIWLFIYIISALPMLKIGIRNPFILNCIFAFVYYVLRDSLEKDSKNKWIGKKEKIIVICAIPVMVISMGAYNYVRAGKSVDLSVANLVVDFAYKQGTTYDTVLQGYIYENQLPMKEQKNYTFGAITDSFFYNSLGKRIFKLDDIGEGNCLRQAYNGHTFSHSISYVVLGSDYIAGNGRGSSYIIENYVDWKFPGVIFFSLFLGIICGSIPLLFRKNWIIATICLSVITNIFFTPRAESTAFLTFLVSYKFWGCIIGCIVLSILMSKYVKTGKVSIKHEK